MKNQDIESYQAILFDFDGVLAECMDVKTEAFAQLYEPYGEDVVKKVVKHHVENGGISRYVKIKYYHEKYLNKNIDEEQVENIASAISKQAQSIDQVNSGMTQLDKFGGANATNAEESGSASRELAAQVRDLREMVNDLVRIVDGAR